MTAQRSESDSKTYGPHAKLKKYMCEKSQYEKRKDELERRGEDKLTKEQREGFQEQLEKITNRLNSLKNTKMELLNEIIFPSMANLCFFFEAIAQDSVLQKYFESDIIELLGIRRNCPSNDNYAFMFRRLMDSIFFPSEINKNNFRFRLIHQLQEIIYSRIQLPIQEVFQHHDDSRNYVLSDIIRAKAWSEMIAERINDEYDFDIQFNKKYGDSEKKRVDYFNKYAAKNKPARTFQFDTKKILSS